MKLHLKNLALDYIHFQIAPNIKPGKIRSGRYNSVQATDFDQMRIKFGVNARLLDNNQAVFNKLQVVSPDEAYDLELALAGSPREPGAAPYDFDIQVSGLFILEKSEDDSSDVASRLDYVEREGSKTLFYYARGFLYNLSNESYFGTLLVPDVDTEALVRKLRSKIEEQKPSELAIKSSRAVKKSAVKKAAVKKTAVKKTAVGEKKIASAKKSIRKSKS